MLPLKRQLNFPFHSVLSVVNPCQPLPLPNDSQTTTNLKLNP